LSIFVLTAAGCFKQKPPEVQPDYRSGVSDLRRIQGCSRLSFGNGFLEKENITALFECTRWDGQFPALYGALSDIESEKWMSIVRPISEEFFDNRSRRDRMIRTLQGLDEDGALGDIGYILDSINEINFYTSWRQLFVCINSPQDRVCSRRGVGAVKMSDIEDLVGLLNISQAELDALTRIVEHLRTATRPNFSQIKREVSKILRSNDFRPLRLGMVGAILKKYAEGLTPHDVQFVQGLASIDIASGDYFPYYLLNTYGIGEREFEDLMKYLVLHREYYDDLLSVAEAIASGIECRPGADNRYLRFSFKSESERVSEIISRGDHYETMDLLLAQIATVRTAEPFCEMLRSYRPSATRPAMNFISMIRRTFDYLDAHERFELASFLTRQSIASGFDGNYLVSMLAGELFGNIDMLNQAIVNSSAPSYKLIHKTLAQLPRGAFEDLEILANKTVSRRVQVGMKAWAKIWPFFTKQDQEFIFRLLDRNFDAKVNTERMFEFYNILLLELSDAYPTFKDAWFKSDRETKKLVQGFEEFARVFAGGDVLADFRKFYSREHILEVIKVITRGTDLIDDVLAEKRYIYSDNYLTSIAKPPSLNIDPRAPLLRGCIRYLGEEESNLYNLIRFFPRTCKGVTDDISLNLIEWLSEIQIDFKLRYGDEDQLLGESGILSPRSLEEAIINFKSLDLIVSGGLEGLIRSVFHHLFELTPGSERGKAGFMGLLDSALQLIDRTFKINSHYSMEYRNALFKHLFFEKSGDRTRRTISFLNQYATWLDTRETSESNIPDPFFSCGRYLNQQIGYRCPQGAREISVDLTKVIESLVKTYDDHRLTPMNLLYEAVRAEGGITIPLNSPNSRLYRLGLRESLEMMHAKVDKTRPINRLRIPYTAGSNEVQEFMTTMERIEVVIRDVRFGRNYLGVQYMNYVSHGDNYNADLQNRKQTLRNCVRLPVIRCGRSMSRDDRRMANNALDAFDGLLDANNGRGIDSEFRYGDYMTALLAVIVGSSPIDAQKVQLLPLGDDLLRRHNGQLLGHITHMAGLSHGGRWLHSRVTSDREEFAEFLDSYAISFLDRTLLKNTPRQQTKDILERILIKIIKPNNRGVNALDSIVRLLYETPDEQFYRVEKSLLQLAFAFAHVGDRATIIGYSDDRVDSLNYSQNNLFEILQLVELFIDNWETVSRAVDGRAAINLIAGMSDFTSYLFEQLNNEESRESAYVFINDLVQMYREIVTMPHLPAQDRGNGRERFRGIELLSAGLEDQQYVSRLWSVIQGVSDYFKHPNNNAEWLRSTSGEILQIIDTEKTSVDSVRDYIVHSTRRLVCVEADGGDCTANPHFDEPAKLLDYLVERASDESNIRRGLRKLYEREFDIQTYLNRTIQNIHIQED
jgi:hypothetical protein